MTRHSRISVSVFLVLLCLLCLCIVCSRFTDRLTHESELASVFLGDYHAVAIFGSPPLSNSYMLFRGGGPETALVGLRSFFRLIDPDGYAADLQFVDSTVVVAYECDSQTRKCYDAYVIDLDRSLLTWSSFTLYKDGRSDGGPTLWSDSTSTFAASMNCISFLDGVYHLSVGKRQNSYKRNVYFYKTDSLTAGFTADDLLSVTVFWNSGKITRGLQIDISNDGSKSIEVHPVWETESSSAVDLSSRSDN